MPISDFNTYHVQSSHNRTVNAARLASNSIESRDNAMERYKSRRGGCLFKCKETLGNLYRNKEEIPVRTVQKVGPNGTAIHNKVYFKRHYHTFIIQTDISSKKPRTIEEWEEKRDDAKTWMETHFKECTDNESEFVPEEPIDTDISLDNMPLNLGPPICNIQNPDIDVPVTIFNIGPPVCNIKYTYTITLENRNLKRLPDYSRVEYDSNVINGMIR